MLGIVFAQLVPRSVIAELQVFVNHLTHQLKEAVWPLTSYAIKECR
jgi:hypothetical protein